jgi:hypothetical protein
MDQHLVFDLLAILSQGINNELVGLFHMSQDVLIWRIQAWQTLVFVILQ